MKVLVIGSGGREHALCWKLKQSPVLTDLYCAPGNPGIAELADLVPIGVDEIQRLADFAGELGIDLTVVGPEMPLALGVVDEFSRRGLAIFGPRRSAALLEGSKIFAKEFMQKHGIPTADFEVAHDIDEARKAAERFGFPVVLKADGPAAGKGVLIPGDKQELEDALSIFFDEKRFGASGERLVVERCLEGEEVSLIAMSDGRQLIPLATSKDYKRLEDGDVGPNTGGMGAHSPAGVLSGAEAREILDLALRPVLSGMAAAGQPLQGFLYAGLMLCSDGPKVLEYNVRLGDPEAQPILMRLEDDLLPVLAAGAAGAFATERLAFRKEAAACLVLASAGYPEAPHSGDVIEGLEAARLLDGVEVFHAGTRYQDDQVVTAGGRVLGVCAIGLGIREALRQAYRAAAEIHWPHKVHRTDIGRRVVESTGSTESLSET